MLVSIIVVVVFVIGIFLYFSLFSPGYISKYNAGGAEPVNPVSGLSQEEAIAEFNESFIFYSLYVIKAYNLHNPPLSSETPKINFIVDEEAYNAEIVDGEIIVSKGEVEEADVILRSTKLDAVKIMNDPEYARQSYRDGNSNIELLASKSTLFGKGYLNLYREITGRSVTGSVIGIYAD